MRRPARAALGWALVTLVCAPPSAAQTAPGRLSLSEVLARVRAEHPVALAGRAAVEAERARAAGLRRYPNPSLEAERFQASGVDNLALLQPIRWPWESNALAQAGAAGVAAAEAMARRDLAAVALDAAQLFVNGLHQERGLALSLEAESLAVSGLQRVQAARELGQVGDLAVLQARVGLDAARRERLAAAAQRDAALAQIAVAIGLDPAATLYLEGSLAAVLPIAAPESALAAAAGTDPELARLASEAERAHQEARAARARRWPELALGPSMTVESGTRFGLSLGLTLPFWSWQGDVIRGARADSAAALGRLNARRRELAGQVLAANATLARSREALDSLRSGELARAQQAEALASEAARQGGPYVSAWLGARQAYLDAHRAESDLEWEAAGARVVLRWLAGTLLEEAAR